MFRIIINFNEYYSNILVNIEKYLNIRTSKYYSILLKKFNDIKINLNLFWRNIFVIRR